MNLYDQTKSWTAMTEEIDRLRDERDQLSRDAMAFARQVTELRARLEKCRCNYEANKEYAVALVKAQTKIDSLEHDLAKLKAEHPKT